MGSPPRDRRGCLKSANSGGQVRKRLLPEAIWQLQQFGSIKTKVGFRCQIGPTLFLCRVAQVQAAPQAMAGHPQWEEDSVEFFGGDADTDGAFERNEQCAVEQVESGHNHPRSHGLHTMVHTTDPCAQGQKHCRCLLICHCGRHALAEFHSLDDLAAGNGCAEVVQFTSKKKVQVHSFTGVNTSLFDAGGRTLRFFVFALLRKTGHLHSSPEWAQSQFGPESPGPARDGPGFL